MTSTKKAASPALRAQHFLHENPWVSPLVLLVLSVAVFTLLNPAFAQPRAISLLLQQTAVVAALAVGQTLIILTGGIDLSVGAAAILGCMSSALLASQHGLPAPAAIAVGILIGALCGLLNGALVSRLKLPPFIVTLGTLSVFTAITLMLTGGSTVQGRDMPEAMTAAGTRIPFLGLDLNVGILVVGLVYLAVGFALGFTAWGRRVYAVGDAPEAARLAGISVSRVLLSVYIVAGIIYGIAAWVLIGRAGAASPNGIVDANLASITAVVIGGTSLFGGRGGVVGTVLGALIVQSFAIGLTLAGLDDEYRVLAVGILVIAAVAADQWIRKVRT
ncbi:ABC transporter permease [Actinoplanes couchii]|uniref:ABC transporter permease n=1 Tax=Actinoplanes couchii TaxID=403638 RepID=A0ABQ3XDH6_9ACTN|nr:ABC transporter permease [Actinoplanes couchii]MDR6317054.1 fructose transport system permease protein [Actinoplanes couchii]GID56549.1 ABC transporter permease [Actinoplanes couchii]